MPVSVPNPYTGKDDDTCSVSFAAQQAYAGGVSSPQTEAEYNRSKLLGEWGVIQAKASQGEIASGTKVMTFESKYGSKGYIFVKNGKLHQVNFDVNNKRHETELLNPKDVDYWIKSNLYKVTIPQAVAPTKDSTGAEPKFADKAYMLAVKSRLGPGETAAATKDGNQKVIFLDGKLHLMEKQDNGAYQSVYDTPSGNIMWATLTGESQPFYQTDSKGTILGTFPKPKAETADPVPDVKLSELTKINDAADDSHLVNGATVLVHDDGSYVTYDDYVGKFKLHEPGGIVGGQNTDVIDLLPTTKGWHLPGAVPPKAASVHVAAPVPATPVNSGSDSVGSMSNEDVAAMFVKIKDDLAKEQGLNIKGANPDLDALVHKEIGKKTGYTEAEVKGKIDQYKADGNKLSALKKKVLLGTKKVPDPKPNAVPTKATATIVNDVKTTVKETVAAKPQAHYSDEDVAAAYIIAKDFIVATNTNGWTLYTKNDEFDAHIALKIKLQTGLTADQQKQAIANYLGSGKKLSTLKKQLAKQGAFTPQADTLKKSGSDKSLADKAKDVDGKADAGYSPTPSPSSAGPATNGKEPKKEDFADLSQYYKAKDEWFVNKNKIGSPVDSGKAAPVRVQKEDMQRGDITIFSEAAKQKAFSLFKQKGHQSYLSSGAADNYDGLIDVQIDLKQDDIEMSLLQLLRIVDAEGAKKAKVDNGNLFEKKVATWLTTPLGEQHIKDAEKTKAAKIQKAKDVAEALKLAKELEANQPALPADSSRFDILPASEADAMHQRMQAAKPWKVKEKSALRYYTTNEGYTAMNGANRRGTGSSTTVERTKDAQAGMRPADIEFLLHRGCDLRQVGLEGNGAAIWGLTGKLLKDEGFMSTSYGGRAAFGGELLIEFQVPKGTLLTNVKPISHYSHENEILLASGTQYRVLRVEKREPRGWKLIVRVEGVDFTPPKAN